MKFPTLLQRPKISMTEEQIAVSEASFSSILVLAGAGTGKTRTLIARIIHLAKSNDAKKFAVVTFTNSAADEVRERLEIENIVAGYVGTLHGLMLRFLYEFGRQIGLNGFSVIDDDGLKSIVNMVIHEQRYKGTRKAVDAILSDPPITLKTPEDFVVKAVFNILESQDLLTFDMILSHGLALIKHKPDDWPYTHLFVDEVQDSADIDGSIYKSIPSPDKFFVGDPRQAIYGFRGADIGFVLDLIHDDGTEKLNLTRNWRSGNQIVKVANNLADSMRLPKCRPLIDNGSNAFSALFNYHNAMDEMIKVSEAIIAEKTKSVAVLLRTNRLVREWTDFLLARNIPIVKRERTEFPEDWPTVIALISWCANPENDSMACKALRLAIGNDKAAEINRRAMERLTSVNLICHSEFSAYYPQCNTADAISDFILDFGISRESRQIVAATVSTLQKDSSIQELIVALGQLQKYKENGEGVFVGTIHSSKGREWDTVFLPAFEQEIIPALENIEEERRVAYVGITRARSKLVLSWSMKRLNAFHPLLVDVHTCSVFVDEAFGNV